MSKRQLTKVSLKDLIKPPTEQKSTKNNRSKTIKNDGKMTPEQFINGDY